MLGNWSIGRGVGRSPGGSLGALDCMRKLLFTAHSTVSTQISHIELVVNALTRDDASELPESTIQHINKEIKGLFNTDNASKLLGMRVIFALVETEYWDFALKITFFYNLTKSSLPSADPQVVKQASKCIAKIAAVGTQRDGGLITGSIVEEELRRSLEWLSARDKYNRWYSACVVIRDLVRKVPELLIPRTELILERIWAPAWSDSSTDREAAVRCFKAVIDVSFIDDQDWTRLFDRVISKVFEGLFKRKQSSVHGSLLCLRELLDYSCGQFQTTDFRALADAVLDGGLLADSEVQRVALQALSKMGRHYEDIFQTTYLEETMNRIGHLYNNSPANRETTYWALSELVTTLGSCFIEGHTNSIVKYIREGMTTQMRRPALKLLGLMAATCPERMEVELGGEEWNALFRHDPITENHFDVFQSIMNSIPSLRKDLVLINKEIINNILSDPKEAHSHRLTLKSIGNIECCIPLEVADARELLRSHVLRYLSHSSSLIREASVEATITLVRHLYNIDDNKSDILVFLEPAIDLSVVDLDPRIRTCVLRGLDRAPELASLYSSSRCVECLFMAFNDDLLDNRMLALQCLCRTADNEEVLGGLNKILQRLTEDLDTVRDSPKQQTHYAVLLALLIKEVPNVVLPMALDVLQVIKNRLRGSLNTRNPQLLTSLLTTLGELNDLINVDDAAAKALLYEFFPLVLDCLEDRHNMKKRLAAVHALIKLIRSTGLVIDFYEEYPHVLPVLLGFLQSKEDWGLQSGVMKLIGTIGAVDPLRAKNLSFWAEVEEHDGVRKRTMIEAKRVRSKDVDIQTEMMKSSLKHQIQQVTQWNWGLVKEVTVALQPPMKSQPGLIDQLPAVSLQALLLILATPTHSIIHPKAIDAIRLVIKSLSHSQLVNFCPCLLVPILKLLRQPSVRDTHSKLFQLLNTLVAVLHNAITPHCEAILSMVKEYWDQVMREASQSQRAQIQITGLGSEAETVQNSSDSATNSRDGPSSGDRQMYSDATTDDKSPPGLEQTTMQVEVLLINLISLVEEISRVYGEPEMREHSKWILQNLIQSMLLDKMERMELIQKCLDAMKSLSSFMQDQLHVVLPVLLEPIGKKDVTLQLKVKALTTLHSLMEATATQEHCGRILHQLLNTIKEVEERTDITIQNRNMPNQLSDLLLKSIHLLCKNTGTAFVRFVPLVRATLTPSQLKDFHIDVLFDSLISNRMLPPEVKTVRRTEPSRVFKPEDVPKMYTCVLGMGIESFNPESFKRTISLHTKIPTRCIDILRTKGPACTVDFRFADMDANSVAKCGLQFMALVRNGVTSSTLGHELRLVEIKEKPALACKSMQVASLKQIWNTRGRRKGRDWEEWINRFSVELLKHAPSQALRACFQAAQAYVPLARDLFPYSFVACFQELDDPDKVELLSHMNNALEADLPPFVLHMILSLAEFMEEERYRNVYSTQGQTKLYKLTRPSSDARFGVGYADVKYDGTTRVNVSKVQTGLAGDRVRLPVGGRVTKLNGTRVRNVKQLSELICGQTTITLEVQLTNVIQRVVTKPGPFFNVDLLATVCERKQLLAKALHYKEERFRDLILELRKAGHDEINALSVHFIELCSTLIHLSNNLGLREGANGILDYSKKYFEDWIRQEHENGDTQAFSKIAGKQLDSMLLLEGRGYEKLQWWSQAIKAYKTQASEDPEQRNKYLVGIMRCYRQLGRWEHLLYEAKRGWSEFDSHSREEIAGMAAHGAWILSAWSNLGESVPSQWEFMETCVDYMPRDNDKAAEREFFSAILSVHKEDYPAAANHINTTRKLLEGRLSSLVGESYARAYNIIVWLQKVMGLEEVIEYKLGSTVKWPQLREVWHKRMLGMQPTVENWQDMLGITALVLEKGALASLDSDDLFLWLKFVSICRRCNRNSLAESTLLTLMGFSTRNFRNFLTDDTIDQHLSNVLDVIDANELLERNVAGHVCLSYFKHLYHCDMRARACDALRTYVGAAVQLTEKAEHLRDEIDTLQEELEAAKEAKRTTVEQQDSILIREEELRRTDQKLSATDLDDQEFLAKAHLTLGEWYQEIHKDNFWEAPYRNDILNHFSQAVKLSKTSSRAWHCWGLHNYRVTFRADSLEEPEDASPLPAEEYERRKENYLVQSLRGFFNSLDYLEDESFCVPNLLRILTIWFRYAQEENIASELQRGIRAIRVSIWIYVLPQLVARVSFPQQRVRTQVEDLLTLLGTEYPHHVVYPLTVCAVHGSTGRRRAAQEILDRLSHGEKEKIFTQARMVSGGLIKTAISWAEYWSSGIDLAAKLLAEEKKHTPSIRKMLLNLYPMLDEADPTESEREFLKNFQLDLETAKRYLLQERLDDAWEYYRRLWENLQEHISKKQLLQLSDVAPELAEAEGLEVAIPGVNHPTDSKTTLIHRFRNDVKVIPSKQKPKVIIMVAEDGIEYKFLLKGHEDLRQDERVMQLLGLINALFQKTDDLYHIRIIRTPVVPLSDNVGLIGWLERTETLNQMIQAHRKARSIHLNLECTFIVRAGQLKKIEQFYKLSTQQKVDLLGACLEKTPSDCLRRVFWSRTATSELWLEYRTLYVRTLAAMSMVGYILGLGDRHPNNIMLTNEGEIVHIDFGDCFDVALNRQRFPEKVPFRLTRLLVQALEASGFEGTFRYTCESVMRCLRKNRDSLTSLLETFVYDPLINWRLLETVAPEEEEAVKEREERAAHKAEDVVSAEDEQTSEKNPEITFGILTHKIPDESSTHEEDMEQEKKAEQAGVDEMNMNLPIEDPSSEDKEDHSIENIERTANDGDNALEYATQLVAKSAQMCEMLSAPRSVVAVAKSVRWEPDKRDDRAWEEELVNEKAKQVVIRIREKLTGYDFPRAVIERNQPTPGVSPRHEPLGDPLDPVSSRFLMLGGGSYERNWVMKAEDDECDIGVSVAHRETWWLARDKDVAASEEGKERCSVPEQVNQLIIAATSVENLSQMFIGWCPFW